MERPRDNGPRTRGERGFSFEHANQMTEKFDYFATYIRTNTTPVATGRHGFADIRTIEAVYESAKTGERVTL